MFDSIIFIILIIIAVIVGFKVLKNIVKALLFVFIIVLLISGLFGFLIYKDISNLKNNFNEQPKLMLFINDTEIITGSIIIDPNNLDDSENIKPVDSDLIANINLLYKDQNLKEIKKNYTRVFIFNDNFIEKGIPTSTSLGGSQNKEYTSPEIIQILKSPQTDYDLKSKLFSDSIVFILDDRGESFFYDQYKLGNVIIYPKTIVFFIAGKLPGYIIKPILWIL